MIQNSKIVLSIVMPAYNEAARIRVTVREYLDRFEPIYGEGFELLVVLNGCTDKTRSVVEEVASNTPTLRIIEFAERLGKGGAIWEGLEVSSGSRVVFVDADNMVPASETKRLIDALETHDVAIADRFNGTEDGGQSQSILRRLISFGSRLWVRLFLGLHYSDTQCGAKAFRASAWRKIAPKIEERGWAFDLEVLTHVRLMNLSVVEVPVRWHHVTEGSKIRAWRDVPATLWATIGIRLRSRRS